MAATVFARDPEQNPVLEAGALRSANRIFVVDDHAMVAAGVCASLMSEGFVVAAADCSSEAGILSQALTFGPTTVLLDLDLGRHDLSALELIAPLRALGAEIVVFTGSRDRLLHGSALERGVLGILHKSASLAELAAAISFPSIAFSATASEKLIAEVRAERQWEKSSEAAFGALTPREAAVLTMMMEGSSAEAIARASYVSLATVRTQIRSILFKLRVTSQLAAVALAYRVHWTNE